MTRCARTANGATRREWSRQLPGTPRPPSTRAATPTPPNDALWGESRHDHPDAPARRRGHPWPLEHASAVPTIAGHGAQRAVHNPAAEAHATSTRRSDDQKPCSGRNLDRESPPIIHGAPVFDTRGPSRPLFLEPLARATGAAPRRSSLRGSRRPLAWPDRARTGGASLPSPGRRRRRRHSRHCQLDPMRARRVVHRAAAASVKLGVTAFVLPAQGVGLGCQVPLAFADKRLSEVFRRPGSRNQGMGGGPDDEKRPNGFPRVPARDGGVLGVGTSWRRWAIWCCPGARGLGYVSFAGQRGLRHGRHAFPGADAGELLQ